MKKQTLWLVVLALCLSINLFTSLARADVRFYEGGYYQLSVEDQPYRVYMDLGDRSKTGEIREGYTLLANTVSGTIQHNWTSYENVPWRIILNKENGTAVYQIGANLETTNTLPYKGRSDENALYITVFSQALMHITSPERGIFCMVDRVNNEPITGGTTGGTFRFPRAAAGGYGMVYGFPTPDQQTTVIEGRITFVNPDPYSAPYDFAFQIGTGLYVEPGTEGRFEFGATSYEVGENSTEIVIPVVRTGGSNGPVTVVYSTSDGTAGGDDYVATSGTLEFEHGETTRSITIPISNDVLVEEDESFSVVLSDPTGGATIGSGTTMITIVSEDLPHDGDTDGIADNWERFWFEGSLTTAEDDTDWDKDGASDLTEFREGTNPKEGPDADARIGVLKTTSRGASIYDPTGETQTVSTSIKRGTTREYKVGIKNLTNTTRNMPFVGSGSDDVFKVRYFYKGKDVTTKVATDTFEVKNLLSGETAWVVMKITARKSSYVRTPREFTSRAGWQKDSVKVVATIK